MTRFAELAVAFLLILAACGGGATDDGGATGDGGDTGDGGTTGDDGDTGDSGTTGDDGDTTTTATLALPDITVEVQDGQELRRADDASFVCLVLSQYVIGPRGATPAGATAVTADDVLTATSEGSLNDSGVTEAVLAGAVLALYDVGAGNSLTFVQANPGFAPIHLLAYANHWEWAPGANPVEVPELSDPTTDYLEPENPGGDGVVVVIDEEVAKTMRPWIDDYVENIGALTGSPESPSHGTYVASLIRQVSPLTEVKVVTPSLTNEDAVLDQEASAAAQGLTTTSLPSSLAHPNELTVLDAIVLAENEYGDASALNLSLGTYPCHDPDASTPTELDAPSVRTMDAAIQNWSGPVYAAAGNGAVAYPFYPGALQSTIGVAAVDNSGNPVAWHDRVVGVTSEPPPSTTLRAPGVHLIAYGDEKAYAWGGSSFATAIASALVATSNQDYTIEGLVFVDGDQVVAPGR